MGGTNEKSIQNLRFHVNGDEVHVHDDISKKKFYCKKDFFSIYKCKIPEFALIF